ncbi:ADP-ribosylglycohydrolase family protein [Georgenia daeguensis]|uniref:ADP-ribosylglycohydrolase family protein n=1 Tax=Georgenia daeguensis TaxID=908355 RepID=A0ABP8EYJ4_9MICO
MLTARHDPDSWRARVRGCLLAGALGDSLGRPFEGEWAVTEHAVAEVLSGAGALTWTDDTSLMVALAEHLAGLPETTDLDDEALARSFARAWHAEPHRGYGANPPRIFAAVLTGGDWRDLARDSFGGAGSLGNGGAMRAAPVGALPGGPEHAADVARQTAAITHAHPDGQDGAALIAVATWFCLRTRPDDLDPAELLSTVAGHLRSPSLITALDAVVAGLAEDEPADVARRTGTGIAAAEAAPAALSAFLHHPADPVAAITFAVAMGGDTDTVATMSGCLSGALVGEQRLPDGLVARLEAASRIRAVADALAERTYRP